LFEKTSKLIGSYNKTGKKENYTIRPVRQDNIAVDVKGRVNVVLNIIINFRAARNIVIF
jgi:hypothetical protein